VAQIAHDVNSRTENIGARRLDRADKTIENIKSAWVKDQYVEVKNGKVSQYRVIMMVTFLLKD